VPNNIKISECIIKYLKKNGPTKEGKVIAHVYLQCNELIPISVELNLKTRGEITVKNGTWEAK
jgi:hypothetical protein